MEKKKRDRKKNSRQRANNAAMMGSGAGMGTF
jgi:hypothetical protein